MEVKPRTYNINGLKVELDKKRDCFSTIRGLQRKLQAVLMFYKSGARTMFSTIVSLNV